MYLKYVAKVPPERPQFLIGNQYLPFETLLIRDWSGTRRMRFDIPMSANGAKGDQITFLASFFRTLRKIDETYGDVVGCQRENGVMIFESSLSLLA